MNLLGVSGSMRADSYSRRAMMLVLEEAGTQGATTRMLELRTAELPLYDPDDVNERPDGCPVTEAVLWAGALLLATPDYHGSMSGGMKNFLERCVLSKAFDHMLVVRGDGWRCLIVAQFLKTAGSAESRRACSARESPVRR